MAYRRKYRDGPMRFAPSDDRPGHTIVRPMTAEERARYWPDTRKEPDVMDRPTEQRPETAEALNPEQFTRFPGGVGSQESAARTRDRVYALADEGLKVADIADQLGIRPQTVSYHLRRRPTETPPQPEGNQTADPGLSETETPADPASDRWDEEVLRLTAEAAAARVQGLEKDHRLVREMLEEDSRWGRVMEFEKEVARKDETLEALRRLDAARAETIAAQRAHVASLEIILREYVRGHEAMGHLLETVLEPDNRSRLKAVLHLLLTAPATTRTGPQP